MTEIGTSDERLLNVILIHGTFMPHFPWERPTAGWTEPASCMVKRLRGQGFTCEPFKWSGRNSHLARRDAASELGDLLRHRHADKVPCGVVAHSHGGNIALHAIAQLRSELPPESRVSIPVVTLATPFFFAQRHKTYKKVLFGAALGAVLFAVMGAFVLVENAFDSGTGDAWWTDTGWLLGAAIVILQLIGLGCWTRAHGMPWSRDARRHFIESAQVPAGDNDLLVIRAADDEASSALAIAQFSSFLGALAIRMSRPQRWIRVYLSAAIISFVLSLVGMKDVSDFAASFFAILVVVICALSFIAVSGPAILSFTQGPDGPTGSMFAFVSAEASPPGTHQIWQAELQGPGHVGMEHSSLYDDPKVVTRIVQHMTPFATRAAKGTLSS